MTDAEKKYIEGVNLKSERRSKIKEFALALLQQCKDENLSIEELDIVIEIIRQAAAKVTFRDGLRFMN